MWFNLIFFNYFSCDELFKFYPNNNRVWIMKATIFFEIGNYEKAIDWLHILINKLNNFSYT